MLTQLQLAACVPGIRRENLERFHLPLVNAMQSYQITTPLRIAAFIAQLAHESGSLNRVEENLNYSAERLKLVFGKYFTTRDLNDFARQPQRIANVVYADRIGNGPESSGDGWRFRGRGLIQLTGRDNYNRASRALGVDLINDPDWLLTPVGATLSAGWFWDTKSLNQFADRREFRTITVRINGGTNGLEDRYKFYNLALRVLNA
jgi:putative chitinase